MRKQIFIFLLMVLPGIGAVAQVVVQGRVLEAEGSEPIPFAHVFVKGTEKGSITDTEGNFSLELDYLPVVLVVSEVAHKTRFVHLTENEVTIHLQPFSMELEEAKVEARGSRYFEMANHVRDFNFYDDLLLILGNSGKEVRLIDYKGRLVDRTVTPGKFHSVFKDCLDNLHLVNADTAYQVFYDYEEIRFIHPQPRPVFEHYLRNCECRYDQGLIYSIGRKRGLVTKFLYASGGSTMPFYEIGDTAALEFLESNYDIDYFLAQRKRGNMRYAMSLGEMRDNLDQLQAEVEMDWMDSRIIHPSAYYIFPEKDELRVFSLGIMTEFRFSKLGSEPEKKLIPVKDTYLDFLTRDETTGNIYAVYRSAGRVWATNMDDPSEQLVIDEYAFPSEVKIRNGYLFFINDPGIDGSNYLFRKNEKFGETEGTW